MATVTRMRVLTAVRAAVAAAVVAAIPASLAGKMERRRLTTARETKRKTELDIFHWGGNASLSLVNLLSFYVDVSLAG